MDGGLRCCCRSPLRIAAASERRARVPCSACGRARSCSPASPLSHRLAPTSASAALSVLRVADGGIFAYPASLAAPSGKLRLLYEVNPMARIFEEAGGRAICAVGASPLDIVPTKLHQRAPIFLGCKRDVDLLESMLAREEAA